MNDESAISVRSPWLPSTAEGWARGPVKYFFRIELGKMLQNAPTSPHDREVPYLKAQHVQWGRVVVDELPTMWAPPNEIDALRLICGDLLVCEGGEVGRCATVTKTPPQDCIIQNALHRVRAKEGSDTRFLGYLLKHAADHGWFDVLCNRATIAHFTVDKFGDVYIAIPSSSQQCAIADYLDRETGCINAVVEAKERWLEILAEKRLAVVAGPVTRGLNPKAPLRDSGISWLGEIPKHWDIERSRWLFRERDERSVTGEEELLTVSHLTGVTPRSEKNVNMFEAETTEGYKICRKGDLVINTLWAWMGAMGVAPQDGIVSPAYNVYTPCAALDPAYIDALVRMPVFAQEVTRYSKGVWSSRLRLYPEGFFEVWFPVPPPEEQPAIVAHIEAETRKLDALRMATERTVALLKERRAALVTAAVTGQLKVA